MVHRLTRRTAFGLLAAGALAATAVQPAQAHEQSSEATRKLIVSDWGWGRTEMPAIRVIDTLTMLNLSDRTMSLELWDGDTLLGRYVIPSWQRQRVTFNDEGRLTDLRIRDTLTVIAPEHENFTWRVWGTDDSGSVRLGPLCNYAVET